MRRLLHRRRLTLARMACELAVLILFAGSARWGWSVAGRPLLLGTLSQSRVLDFIALTDPLALLERLCAGVVPTASALAGAAIITLFYGLIGSRAFCGWICPMTLVVESAAWLRGRLSLPADLIRLPRSARMAALAAALLASLATGSAAFETVSPQALLWRDLIFGTGLSALSAALAIFALELGLMREGWCGHLCPLGALWSLIGRVSPAPLATIRFDDARCTRCAQCIKVCPERQVIRFHDLARTGRIPSGDCMLCGRCVEVCEEEALGLHLGRTSLTATKTTKETQK